MRSGLRSRTLCAACGAFILAFLGTSGIALAVHWTPTYPPPGSGDAQWVQASGHDCGADLFVYVDEYSTSTLTWNTYISHMGHDPHFFMGECKAEEAPDSEASLEWTTTFEEGPGTVTFYVGASCKSIKGNGSLLVNRSQYTGSLEVGTDSFLSVGGSWDWGNSPMAMSWEEKLSNSRPSYQVDYPGDSSQPWEVQKTITGYEQLPDVRLDTMAFSWVKWTATNDPCIIGPPSDHSVHAPTATLDAYWEYTLTEPIFLP